MSEHDNNNDNNDRAVERDYAVGYCRPPKSSQFLPGKSGNPKGRKRKPLSLQAQMQKVVAKKVLINEGGKAKRLSLQDVIFQTIANKAAKGDLHAAKFVFTLLNSPEYADTDAIDQTSLPPEDRAMLGEMMKQLTGADGSGEPLLEEGGSFNENPQDQDEHSPIPVDSDDENDADAV